MPDIIAFLLCIGALGAVVAGIICIIDQPFKKKPCTCPKCRPDLYEPKTPEEYDQRAALMRARARFIDGQIELKMKEAEHADVAKLINELRSKANA